MKRRTMIWACLVLAGPPVAARADPAVEAPLSAFMDAFNKDDQAAAARTHLPAVTITDEVAPYVWSGTGAFRAWSSALAKDSQAQGITDESVSIGAPTRELVTGDRAYVIVPSTYSFRLKGAAMREVAQMTFALSKTAGGWKIAGWTWTGPDATPAP